MASPDGVVIHLDPEEAARRKAERTQRLNTVEVPVLRVIGMAVVAGLVLLHNTFLTGPLSWAGWLLLLAIMEAYAVLSWLVLARFSSRVRRFDLGLVFLIADLVIWDVAIYHSGGERSALFFILCVRVADQVNTSFRRTMVFAHLSALAYLGLAGYLAFVEQRPLAWPGELAKIFFIYGGNIYMSLAARTADTRRRQISAAIRVARDLIRRLEERSAELAEAKQRAEVASRAKSQFLATMSHELRTPLNALIGFSKVLLNRTDGDLNERQEVYVRAIHTSGNHLLALIGNVLDVARIEAGRLELRRARLDVRLLVDECVEACQALVRDKPIKIETDVPLDLPAVDGDATKVKQIILNLVANAVKFTTGGLVMVRVAAEPTAVRVSVADTGVGIREADLTRLFEPFNRLSSPLAADPGGVGLGLAISKSFVELHGGRIWVESRQGQGSTFHFTLPLG